jgi:RecA-family ATPase
MMDKTEKSWLKGTPHGSAINSEWSPPILDCVDPCSLHGKIVPERKWLVDGWIPARQVTMVSGDGGVGKSLLALQLATAAATGTSWLGMPVAPAKTLVIACEDEADELHRRQADINRAMGLDFADLDRLLWADRVGQDNLLFASIWDEKGYRQPPDATDLYRSILRHCLEYGFQLVEFDSLHDLFGGNENARSEARRFIQLLNNLAQEIDGSVVLTAHPSLSGRASGTGESGSTAWNNSVRSRLYLSRPSEEDADNNERILSRKKANYATIGDVVRLQWADGCFVNKDQGFGIVASLDRAGQQKRCNEAFLELLAQREKENRPVSHKSRSGNYAPTEFAKHPNRQGYRKADFARAMEALFDEGRIQIVEYGNRPSRQHQKISQTKE